MLTLVVLASLGTDVIQAQSERAEQLLAQIEASYAAEAEPETSSL